MKGRLTLRLAAASALLAVVVGAAFVVLLSSAAELRGLQQQARQSEEVLVVANLLERLVIDLETGLRGFVITGQENLLQPWQPARAAIPAQAGRLEQLVGDNPDQLATAQRIDRAVTSYLNDYSIPLITLVRQDPAAARTVAVTEDGKRHVDVIRAEFDRFVATESVLAAGREDRAEAAEQRATLAAGVGMTVSLLLIVLFAGYLTAAIARPVRRAAAMAGRIAGGDLDARLPQHGPGEIGVLQRSFNTMARSLRNSRAELAASRARIVAAADQERRRIERDLHDGIQQRLVALVLDLRAVEAELPPDSADVRSQLGRTADGLTAALDELRELSRGIHPAILSEGGLAPALKALSRRSSVPAELDADVPIRLREPVEVAAYYVVSEALTNAAKHAEASIVHIDAHLRDGRLRLAVRDDGVGGATRGSGSGLIGLTDRVEALGGTLSITGSPGQGTTLVADLPLEPAGR
jgi:signal transduction histidine kinase